MKWRTVIIDAVLIGLIICAAALTARAECGRNWTTPSGWVSVVCVDYDALARATGATMLFGKSQQVWVKSDDATIKGFRVTLRYRKNGAAEEVVQYTDRHPVYASGAVWTLGDVEIVGVVVMEVREAIIYVF